jgi:prevent-host-death family protein
VARIERITPSEAKRKLASVLHTVEYGQKPVVFERHGREIAALIPIELYAIVRDFLQNLEDEEDWKEIQRALTDPENAVPLEWDPTQYGRVVQHPHSSDRPQEPASRTAHPSAKGASKHRRARR